MREVVIDALATALAGSAAAKRTGAACTTPDASGQIVQFPDVPRISGWAERIRRPQTLGLHPILAASYVFAEIMLSHPYKDGNGRVARALFQATLGACGVIDAPTLPIGPIFHANFHNANGALRELSETGNWSDFAETMSSVVWSTIRLLDEVDTR